VNEFVTLFSPFISLEHETISLKYARYRYKMPLNITMVKLIIILILWKQLKMHMKHIKCTALCGPPFAQADWLQILDLMN